MHKILINEIPDNCYKCPCADLHNQYCNIYNKQFNLKEFKPKDVFRPKYCCLKTIKEYENELKETFIESQTLTLKVEGNHLGLLNRKIKSKKEEEHE